MAITLMRLEADLQGILKEIFTLVVRSGVTKLRANTRLGALVAYEDERDPKVRQKHENLVEEMRSVSRSTQY